LAIIQDNLHYLALPPFSYELEDVVRAEFYCPHVFANSD